MTLSHVYMTFIEDFVTQFRLTSIEPHGSSLSWMVRWVVFATHYHSHFEYVQNVESE